MEFEVDSWSNKPRSTWRSCVFFWCEQVDYLNSTWWHPDRKLTPPQTQDVAAPGESEKLWIVGACHAKAPLVGPKMAKCPMFLNILPSGLRRTIGVSNKTNVTSTSSLPPFLHAFMHAFIHSSSQITRCRQVEKILNFKILINSDGNDQIESL